MRFVSPPRPTGEKSRHLLIVLNRHAARKRLDRFDAVLSLLDQAGCTYQIQETQAAGDAARFAAAASRDTADGVVVAGGDGTINDAINGFHPQTPPLGLLPVGTANVLAHEIGLGTDPAAIARTLLAGAPVPVLPGQVNGRRFMMMASIGFDAHVVQGIRKETKRRFGKIIYAVEALRQLVRYPCPALTVQADGQTMTAATVIVSRGKMYGGRFIMAPEASLLRPELTLSLFPRPGRWAMAGYSAALPLGLLNRWNLITHRTARSVTIACRPGDPVQADGDVISALPVSIGLADHPIPLLMPPRT